MTAGIARRDVVRRFIIESLHAAVPKWKTR
jgi:hypothetical protein